MQLWVGKEGANEVAWSIWLRQACACDMRASSVVIVLSCSRDSPPVPIARLMVAHTWVANMHTGHTGGKPSYLAAGIII